MTIRGYFFELTSWLPPELSLTLWTTVKIMAICVPLMLSVAYLTFAERKIIGYIQDILRLINKNEVLGHYTLS